MRRLIAFVVAVALLSGACSAATSEGLWPEEYAEREALLDRAKAFEESIGYEATRNFLSFTDETETYYVCYYTGVFELVASADELDWDSEATASGCSVNDTMHDTHFYPREAAAFPHSDTLTTRSLLETSTERFLYVVFHEDLHEQIWGITSMRLNAAATEIVSLVAAAAFAQNMLGDDSAVAKNLKADIHSFYKIAQLEAEYADRLRALYSSPGDDSDRTRAMMTEKEEVFAELRAKCEVIGFRSTSTAGCGGYNNNAGLAMRLTYSTYYPLAYDLYVAQGEDIKTTIAYLIGLSENFTTEEAAVAEIEAEIVELTNKTTSEGP